jgi:pimeloyl-ACP methyl ester carboxylesterase
MWAATGPAQWCRCLLDIPRAVAYTAGNQGDETMHRFLLRAAMAMACCLSLATTASAREAVDTKGPLIIKSQGSFFVGGTTRHSTALSGVETDPEPRRIGDITVGQMYVQYQVPQHVKHPPIVMVHGGGLSGQSWETTPDGRMGWSEYFVRGGFPVYIADQVARGRSGFDGTVLNEVRMGIRAPKDLAPTLNIGHEYAWTWFRIGPKYGVPYPDTQFPVGAIEAFQKMWIPDLIASLPSDNPTFANLAALGRKTGGAVIMGHSETFMFPERAALADAAGVKGMISLESGYACATSFKPEQLAVLARIPLLIVFADHHAEAPEPFGTRWTGSLKECRAFADALRAASGDVTFLHLPEAGIHGNTHMFMLDKNNLKIADLVFDWIEKHVQRRAK